MILAISLLSPMFVYAHQSGCHRWHSCPSDSGSYVCGDLGYTSECGFYEASQPDYFAQGNEAGTAFVDENSTYITSHAESDGLTQGTADGEADDTEDNSTDANDFCSDVNFKSQTSPQDYYDGFMESYTDGCLDLYNEHYAKSYDEAYLTGKDKYDSTIALQGESADVEPVASDNGTDWSVLWWLGGGVALFTVIGNWGDIKQWWEDL